MKSKIKKILFTSAFTIGLIGASFAASPSNADAYSGRDCGTPGHIVDPCTVGP